MSTHTIKMIAKTRHQSLQNTPRHCRLLQTVRASATTTHKTIRGSTAAQSSSNRPQTMLFTAQSLAYLTGKLTTQQQRWQQLD
jgi:hypothetical protein